MKLDPCRLFPAEDAFYYLYGEDRDALLEAAEHLLGRDQDARLLRFDINEVDGIGNEIRHDSLFGPSRCHALVRNAEQANQKQARQLMQLAEQPLSGMRIIVCAAKIDMRKAVHKNLLAVQSLKHCRFNILTPEAFQTWLLETVRDAGLKLTDDARTLLVDQLQGKRQAARQAVQRLLLYVGQEREKQLDAGVVGLLLGERLSEDIAVYCHHVACCSPKALTTLHRLVYDQLISEVQILGWLQPRFAQILLYKWYAAKDPGTAMKRARIFYSNRQNISSEAGLWSARDLILALGMMTDTERKLKGASVESKFVALEYLTRNLLAMNSIRL